MEKKFSTAEYVTSFGVCLTAIANLLLPMIMKGVGVLDWSWPSVVLSMVFILVMMAVMCVAIGKWGNETKTQ